MNPYVVDPNDPAERARHERTEACIICGKKLVDCAWYSDRIGETDFAACSAEHRDLGRE